jgi:hypothetical protein
VREGDEPQAARNTGGAPVDCGADTSVDRQEHPSDDCKDHPVPAPYPADKLASPGGRSTSSWIAKLRACRTEGPQHWKPPSQREAVQEKAEPNRFQQKFSATQIAEQEGSYEAGSRRL